MATVLAQRARYLGPAKTQGVLYDLGDYPGLVPTDDEHAQVVGELYELHDPVKALPELDEYEGCGPNDKEPHEYIRQIADVVLEQAHRVEAWVYYYRGPRRAATRIRGGE